MSIRVTPTDLDGVWIVEPRVFDDARGSFFESWHRDKYAAAGLPASFVQDNVSRSSRGVLRGLHFQEPYPQTKLVQVLDGEIYDVAVDVRVGSPTFGRWAAVTLSAENRRQMFIGTGFAHGFYVVSDSALVNYKCTEFYRADTEQCVRWNDPAVGVPWPVTNPILSAKDDAAPLLARIAPDRLPAWKPATR